MPRVAEKHTTAKPARPAGAETVEQRIWTVIRCRHALGKRLTLPDVVFDARVNEGTAGFYFERLLAGGYLEPAGRQPRNKTSAGQFSYAAYRLARDVGMTAPRLRRDGSAAKAGLSREQMWRTVKILREFDARDLSLAASTLERVVKLSDARTYLGALERGGYVCVAQSAKLGPRGSLARYRFRATRNTGPRPPVVQARRAVFDPNLGRVVWPR